MPVVINDFEIITDDQRQPAQPADAQSSTIQTTHGSTPYEIENALRREKERLARVQAH
jgi:hypothetical protein